jgi:hypothetical protein
MATEDTVLVEVNSSLRLSGIGSDTDANFGFTIPDGVIRRVPKRVKVYSAVIPFAWSLINSGNNKFSFTEGSSDFVITLDQQNYSAASLASSIKGQMDALGTYVYSVTVNAITNIFTIAGTGVFNLDFSMSDSIGPILGYGNGVYVSDTSYEASNIVNLVYDGYVHINSSIARGKDNGVIILKGDDVDVEPPLAAVPICGDYGFVLGYQAPTDLQPINIEGSKFSTSIRQRRFPVQLDFQLTSPTGATIDMKGVSWSMVLQFFYN